jgi:heme/copper-type cytochrome/quinol oxidase subunit 3
MWLSLVPTRTSRPDGPDASGGPLPDQPLYGLGRAGMWLFFASLTTFFSPLLIIYAILRLRYPVWPPPGLVLPLPGFLAATALLIAVSIAMVVALHSIRADQRVAFGRWIIAAALLAAGFVAVQVANWFVMFEGRALEETWSAAGFLYFFTAIHALHVIGGIVPLIFITLRAVRGRYSRFRHTGVRFVAMYWHFIDAVWLVMLAAFFIP